MKNRNRTLINLICSVMVLVVNTVINFWLSPYIVSHIGVEANGFVGLANNFITYANLIVTALNGMAARYITIAYAQKDYKKANIYYNSVFWGNLIIVAALIIPAICLIIFFENLFDVPADILIDVKILFAFVFAGFFANTGAPNWNVGCYASNRLDREYIPETITTILKAGIIIGAITIFIPHVWYIGLGSFVAIIILLIVNCINTRKLTPELKIKTEDGKLICSFSAIKELVGSGLWNSISNMGNILLSGLDLLICNILLGSTAMGILSIAKTLPNLLQQLSASLTRAFAPELTINYATGNHDKLKKDINRSMQMTGTILTIFVAGFIVFGKDFFQLWVPSQDAQLLAILSALSFLGYIFTSGTQILYNVFSTTNKVKESSIAQLTSGIISILVTFILIKTTNLGLYAVAGVSTVCNFIRNMSFTLPMTAKYLGFKKSVFFPTVLKTFISTLLISLIGWLIIYLIPITGWFILLLDAIIVGLIGLILNLFIMLTKEDRIRIISKIRRKN